MPETGIPDDGFSKDLVDKVATGYESIVPVNQEKLLMAIEENDTELIGTGVESIVIGDKVNPEKVIAIAYRDGLTPEEAKQEFYLHRIMSTLFPHNFPHFYAAFSGSSIPDLHTGRAQGRLAGTIRQRVNPYTPGKFRRFTDSVKQTLGRNPIEYPFSKVVEASRELGIPLDQFTDFGEHNFIVGADGGEYFIDNLGHWDVRRNDLKIWRAIGELEPSRFHSYMRRHRYSETDTRVVDVSLQRLRASFDRTNSIGVSHKAA